MKKTHLIIGIIALVYLAVLVGKSVYTNYKTDQKIKELKTELDALETENKNLQNQIAYYQTESFKEKEARRKLGLVKPDEKVVILQNEPQSSSSTLPNNPSEQSGPRKPNYQLWWEYFTKDKTIKLSI